MLHIFFSTLPFLISLWWLVRFALAYKQSDKAKRMMTWFMLATTLLYLCHAYYFICNLNVAVEGMWVLCSLSVYPLFYQYICQLTSEQAWDWHKSWILTPALLSAICIWLGAVEAGQMMHKVLFAVQVLLVAYFGYRRLIAYDKAIQQVYADTNQIETRPLSYLLLCFVATSFCSAIFNIIGKQHFHDSPWMVIIPSMLFSTMIFLLCLVVFKQEFVATTLCQELQDDSPVLASEPISVMEKEDEDETARTQAVFKKITPILNKLMEERQFYLRQDIKIGDLAREVGTCRTYLSNYLNKELGTTFSEYINRHRIDYAKQLIMERNRTMTLDQIASMSGFSSEVSFYRNFKKYAAMTPEEWMKTKRDEC